ncbi:MAG: FAD-dependent oxidoreductase [Pseudomonadota bacterium]
MQTQTLIIGGGLAGLSLALKLAERGDDFLLAEARDRLGGRILTETRDGGYFDLGPAWYWPGQPRMAALVERLDLTRFDQHYQGDVCFEDETGAVQFGRGFASMQGSYRLEGGFGALVDAIATRLPGRCIHLGHPITSIARTGAGIVATTDTGTEVHARQAVLALPPRVATQISFTPALSGSAVNTMHGIPTWMAGQAKAVALYDRPFWREANLSGDAMSRRGPIVELHDASPLESGPYALFGFLGTAPAARKDQSTMRSSLVQQLVRLFGTGAETPKALYLKDWAFDRFTATAQDMQPLAAHPRYGLPDALERVWEGRLIFGSTEVATEFGGFLEGALEAAETAFAEIEIGRGEFR